MDKTTKRNIIWATNTFADRGKGFQDREQITKSLLLAHPEVITPRVAKTSEEQLARTRKKAEVFTPSWICAQMNNHCDDEWFGKKDVFNVLLENHSWIAVQDAITFPEGKTWQSYVDSRRLEITCGEAPFLVSRYDATTGSLIEPPNNRIGILDRKLRVVNENTVEPDDWLKWTIRAFESVYGFEYQGDNLLIARINLLLTFCDYYQERWDRTPNLKMLCPLANKIAWNIWQMDGFKDTVPLGKPQDTYRQVDLFEMFNPKKQDETAPLCKIQNWRGKQTVTYRSLKEK